MVRTSNSAILIAVDAFGNLRRVGGEHFSATLVAVDDARYEDSRLFPNRLHLATARGE